ncbi:GNAT family N-acetyltransferase [Fictibacillus phosphorivorans]|uniref:GNAT family N-acetyltransferase n=1 Tax=Fictibacillus phosphorivorans TaxID=1221500 RepID=UPI00203D0C62|nr:GNAT family N-acetyltransferase [Fictibacillus phosphorivorans]MCM3719930.1 GNAT family N-acetyltransferase [Fictibacillus phosphorivorans]MCM3777616.1 GNAT family N-acetyltransferase [Fictibacillus phosphorivorans]
MEIRLLTPEDAEAYWEMRLEALKNHPEAFATSYEEALERENPIEQTANRLKVDGDFTFGAFQENSLIGSVTLVQDKITKMKHRAHIFAMYVKPEHRHSGAGNALVKAAINHAKQIPDLLKLNLTVVSSNEKAKALYSSLGFTTYGKEEKALRVNETYYDEELMVLFLK